MELTKLDEDEKIIGKKLYDYQHGAIDKIFGNKWGYGEAFDEGFKAFFRGDFTCNYRLRSHYYREWHRGFNSAFFYNGDTHVQSIPIERLQQVR